MNASQGGGQLTTLGWFQGEALGRRLRTMYGLHSVDSVEVVSTDMPRTVETAHAVLTGLMGKTDNAITIRVDTPSPWVPNTRCAQLAEMMQQGREQLRQNGPRPANDTQTALRQAFSKILAQGPLLPGSLPFGILAVHDDCQARRWHGKPPSPCIDVALCDAASREATREVMTALAAHGLPSYRLSAGPMCFHLAKKIRGFMEEEAVRVASGCQAKAAGDGEYEHKLMLISAHDTSIFTLLNAISPEFQERCIGGGGGSWPPFTSCVTIDVMSNRLVISKLVWMHNDARAFALLSCVCVCVCVRVCVCLRFAPCWPYTR